ncbi:peroxidase [Microbispora rosea subsp. aerata]|nr:Dyp-type peroxidase [Microbispora rosea]GGO19887.1 peroxidase [Microbispora rosea subsp. aerata]GIH57032.1 peroxidase [Microbispora rosea subsp. aerata]GLJ83489.1 peroxidase [Microbispora rosea subsp. aerata]
MSEHEFPPGRRLTRRGLLAGGAVAAAAACVPTSAVSDAAGRASAGPTPLPGGDAVEPFHGVHQAGIATSPQTFAVFVGFDLRPGTDRAALTRLLRLLTDDARRLTRGEPALADTDAELALLPARLTVTFGFGAGLFKAAGAGHLAPQPLPAFKVDALQPRWSDGDLLIQVCADDRLTLAHALRVLVRDARSFATVRWAQHGFRQSPQVRAPGTTQRNLMGQLDGTVNPRPGTADFERAVWVRDGWLRGGTTLVLRRIRMDLEKWDAADRAAKEFSVGRRLDTGAPLTGHAETDEPDFAALSPSGLPVISEYAHIRRARVADPGMRILRRAYNYEDGLSSEGRPDAGLLFASYQADVARQFVPIQQRIAEADLLNQWITPIGSAVFAIPPGCSPDGWIGETLLS